MENFQVGCLIVGAVILSWQAGVAKQPHERLLFVALALFFVTFALREFDVRKGDWPVASTILSGTVRNLWLGGLWLIIAWHGYRHRANAWAFGWRWLKSGAGRVILIAGLFWILGAAVDKIHPFGSRRRNMLGEELLEANAALLMTFSALVSLLCSRKASDENDLSTWTPAAEAHDGPI